MLTRRPVVLISLACLIILGCKPIRRPQRAEWDAQHDTSTQPHFVEPPKIDDADLVIGRCGRPRSDAVLPIYDKLNNGPVRRMVFHAKRTVTFDFIPSHPIAKVTAVRAPFKRPPVLPRHLPPDSVWRFDDARMDKEEMLTSNRINFYLPCAAAALAKEY
jgi:hypothetical protein